MALVSAMGGKRTLGYAYKVAHWLSRDFGGKPVNGAIRQEPVSVVLTSDESSGPTIMRENHRRVLRLTLVKRCSSSPSRPSSRTSSLRVTRAIRSRSVHRSKQNCRDLKSTRYVTADLVTFASGCENIVPVQTRLNAAIAFRIIILIYRET